MNNYFHGIVGQEKAKRKLSLYLDGYKKTSLLPNLLFEGANGAGKTILAHRVADLTGKEWLEVNGSTIKDVKQFVNQVLLDMATKPSLLFLDELHAIPKSVADLLLSVTNPTKEHKNIVHYNGIDMEFDFREVGFLFATTERQKIFKPLLSRLTPVSLSEYDSSQLATIIKLNSDGIKITDEAAALLGTYTRGTGRSAALMGREIANFCNVYDLLDFDMEKVYTLMEVLDIFPLGLTEQEVAVLSYIRDSKGGITLTALSAKTGHTRDAQQDMEQYLQRHGLMVIEGVRQITQDGMAYLKKIGR